MKTIRFFGKRWTWEWDGHSVYITDAHSAATAEFRESKMNPGSYWCSEIRMIASIPPYIMKQVRRRLFK